MNRRAQPINEMGPVQIPAQLVSDPGNFGGARDGQFLRGKLVVKDDRVVGLAPADNTLPPQHIVLPRLSEPHVHLDKCHTVDRLPSVGGDLAAAIQAQAADREHWTEADIRARATRGLSELKKAGCGAVRSHIDWSNAATPPVSWYVLQDLSSDLDLTFQIAALTSTAALAEPVTASSIAQCLAAKGGVLGAFVFDQPDRRSGIEAAFGLADKHGLALDFHVDEGLATGLDGLELIADVALEMRHQGPVLCGHACSLMNLEGKNMKRVAGKLAKADIAVAALPATNLYLQGRSAGTPDRRGITRIQELRDAGVTVTIGADNVRDAFCPIGNHNPLTTLSLAVLGAHLDPPFEDHLDLITTSASKALGLAPTTVDGAVPGDLLVFDATSLSDLIARQPGARRLSEMLQGELI